MNIDKITNRALLKGAVQQNITCKLSGAVLDVKTAVSVTITGPSGSKGNAVYAGEVFDSKILPAIKPMQDKGFTVEIIDGRKL